MSENPAWLKITATFLILILLGISFKFASSKSSNKSPLTPIAIFPTPTPTIPPITVKTVNSGDGSVGATLSIKSQADGYQLYTLSTTDKDNTRQIFNKTLIRSSSIIVPQNSWSPNNKIFFIIENSGAGDQYLVYKLTGESFPSENFLNVTDFWNKSKINLSIRAVTGWAGHNLLQIQTNKADGSRGQNYWFNTDTLSFLPLSS